jgi:ABC-type transporter Mla maintaining outer membrane lipid asymmetry permease subunit MlaE
MFRELAPMMTAIIVAGRTGSAYTAEIGMMQVTEEVDALRTLGVSPMDILVLPKQCGSTLKIIAAIEDPAVIAKILTHLGLSARAPPRAPARPFALLPTV